MRTVERDPAPVTERPLDRDVRAAVDAFVRWLDRQGPLSQDHLDFYMGGPGSWAKSAYHRSPVLGAVAVAPFALADAFVPRTRKLIRAPRRFPIADAHYALAFLSLARTTGADEHGARARGFLDALEATRCPNEADYCWGYPFDWQTVTGRWPRGRPLITQTPYGFEAFAAASTDLGDPHDLEVVESVARFAAERIPTEELGPGVVSAAYTPEDDRRVINAVAYRAMILTVAGTRFRRDDWLAAAAGNVRFVLATQSPDGAWPYAVDGHDAFVDNFHTCFVLKNLHKIWRRTGDEEVLAAIRLGYAFYKERLLDENGQPIPFHRRPRMTLFRRQLYDYAEGINLALLLRDVDPGRDGDRGHADAQPAPRLDAPGRALRNRTPAPRLEPDPVPPLGPGADVPRSRPPGGDVSPAGSVNTKRLLVIGASGVGWELLDAQIEQGRMPNLATIVRGGVSATLLSERVDGDIHFRPQVAWATLATGCSAERHGVTRFFHEGGDLKEKPLWDHWQDNGLSVGIFGWPGTWPPQPTRGFVVPSHLARDHRTWPRELSQVKGLERLQQNAERDPKVLSQVRAVGGLLRVFAQQRLSPVSDARVCWAGARATVAGPDERRLLLRRAKLDLTADVFRSLVRRHRPDCAAFVTFYVDFALHRYWRDWQPQLFGSEPARTAGAAAIPQAFRDLDRVVGRILRTWGDGSRSIVAFVSEHGMLPETDSPEIGPVYYGIRGERVLELVGLGGTAETVAIARWIAYRPRPGGRLPAEIADRLRQIVVVESGLPLFSVHEHGVDEVVVKLRLPRSVAVYSTRPLTQLTTSFGGRVVPFEALTRPLGKRRSGMHSERAAFAVAGPGIRRDDRIADAQLVDVLPTLAAACGVPLPNALDGRCLDVFA